MKRCIQFLIFTGILFNVMEVSGQFSDSFSDGNLTENPSWTGDISHFIVNEAHQLQLYQSEEGRSVLAVDNYLVDSTEWFFWISLGFAPSSNNYVDIYLSANATHPLSVTDGYLLRFGESGTDDAITLISIHNHEETEICRGTAGLIASSFSLAVKVVHTSDGTWQVFTDPFNNGIYQLEAEGTEQHPFESACFVIDCHYTMSNSDNFVFDDFIVRPMTIDTEPPQVDSVNIVTANSLKIVFNEAVDEDSALLVDNYMLSGGVGNPEEVVYHENAPQTLTLFFETAMENHQPYILTVENVSDLNGNVMTPYEFHFEYLEPILPHVFDVVINELMVDVNPEPEGLPAYDYVELFNTTNELLNLSGVSLQFGTHQYLLPDGTGLLPNDFLLITDDDADFPETVNRVSFTSFPVNNESRMTVKGVHQEVLHTIDYKTAWYDDDEKAGGGWSLEMGNPDNPCGGNEIYSASSHPDGGTPGFENTFVSPISDETPPEITYVEIEDVSTLVVSFSESMDSTTFGLPQQYHLFPDNVTPDSMQLIYPEYGMVRLFFEQMVFQHEAVFTLQVPENLSDCVGNELMEHDVIFSNHQAVFGEILITELMADENPPPRDLPAVEYVELFNTTSFPIDLSGCHFMIGDKIIDFPPGIQLQPEEYLLMAEEDAQWNSWPDVLQVSSLGINNDGALLALSSPSGEIIHAVDFSDEWYGDMLKAEGGWSLEMIDYENFCGQKNNWSASLDKSGGTPGGPNSVYVNNPDEKSPDIKWMVAIDSVTYRLAFTESMDYQSLFQLEALEVEPDVSIQTLFPVKPLYEQVAIIFNEALEPKTPYSIDIRSGTLKDCVGNGILTEAPVAFGIPVIPDSGMVVFNELLFYPFDGEAEFVELMNVSDNFLDLSAIVFQRLDETTGEVVSEVVLSPSKIIWPPSGIMAFTKNTASLQKTYGGTSDRNMLNVINFPALLNDGGHLRIISIEGKILDEMTYNESMHYELLQSPEGVSLEKINPLLPSAIVENWHSASEQAGFATPGMMNSQLFESGTANENFELSTKLVTPDNDGQDDVLQIKYTLDKPGFSSSVTVYDAGGRKIRQIAANVLLGQSGSFIWNVEDDSGQLVPSGYYVVFIEVFNLDGERRSSKKTIAVGY